MSTLYIVSTPIGNLSDLSRRARRTLTGVDLILCEDTRVTRKLLSRYEISTKTVSYHQHSKLRKMEYILKQLKTGKNLALVSDAGTPGISDPGAKLISFLLEKLSDLRVTPIPGPSAVIAALSISGFPAERYVFMGFPPVKKKRRKYFQEILASPYTIVFYESRHRIIRTLEELADLAGDKQKKAVVCQELTKKFETIYRGSLKEILARLQAGQVKGEFVVVVR